MSVGIAQAAIIMPSITEHINTLAEACDSRNLPRDFSALLIDIEDVGLNSYHTPGPILLVRLPNYFSENLDELSLSGPSTLNLTSLDKLSVDPLSIWCAKGKLGLNHCIAVPNTLIDYLLVRNSPNKKYRLPSGRIIFHSGGRITFSSFWYDEYDDNNAQAAGMSSQSYIHYSQKALAKAQLRTQAAGSTRPWHQTAWQMDDGSFFSKLHIYATREQ